MGGLGGDPQFDPYLGGSSFEKFVAFPASGLATEVLGQHVMVARAPSFVKRFQPGELRKYLQQKLPEYMVPSAYTLLDGLPLSANGKVDRRALPSPTSMRPELAIHYVMPQTESEKLIAAVWQDVLELEKVGIGDNFFDLGGNSLLTVQVQSKLSDIFQRELSIVELFTFPTIQELAQHLSEPSAPIETAPTKCNSTIYHVGKTAQTVPDCLVPLQSQGDGLPFFCVHPLAGVVFPYVELALILGHNQPFYGIASPGSEFWRDAPDTH
ncbi:MAG: hypothetical protein GDA43_26195 [Hormoscilla sp. SP5CHS1]|nr:hypothetical protein [Hormoscilla sp. SP12CHS1]MBC6456220.1 hypothetical protein [Hormoscilla sp. SP5CHS1]